MTPKLHHLCIVLLALFCFQASAQDRPWWETGYDASYSPDNPPGPSFTEDQKKQQREAGLKLLADLRAAYAEDADSFTIPPGDYRFGTEYGAADSFVLKDMDRDGKTAFRIVGYGATLWFDLGAKPQPTVDFFVRLSRCRNITLEGLTIDSDPRGVMEGRITAFDFEGNRIQMEPLEGTRLITEQPALSAACRFHPYKANGHLISSYFQISDRIHGPQAMVYTHFTVDEDGRYWFELAKPHLLETVRNPTWREVYGSEGTLEIGDLLVFVWSNARSINLELCKGQITVKDCKVYAKSTRVENGYGDNKWINCRFTPRPGSNNLQGGDGFMSSECVVGSLVDGQINHRTTDDINNFRAVWRYVDSIEGRSITFRRAPSPECEWGFEHGDKAEFYDIETRQLIGVFTVDSAEEETRTVTFQEPLDAVEVNDGATFRRYQNNGWIVRNSLFLDCYQRFLIHAGDGALLENNRIERLGSTLCIFPGLVKQVESGMPDNLVIRNNVIVDSGVTPGKPTVTIEGCGRPIRNLTFRGNLICNSGREPIQSILVDGLTIEDNIVVNPFDAEPLRPEPIWTDLPAFTLDRVKGATIKNNVIIRRGGSNAIASKRSSTNVVEKDNETRVDPDEALETRIRELTATHDRDARAILKEVRAELKAGQAAANAVENEPLESRPMRFDAGEGYREEIPAGYEIVFDPRDRFPKAPQTVFFSPTQPANAWGEPSVTYYNGRYYLWFLNWGGAASLSLATSTDGVFWREEGCTFLPDQGSRGIGESEVYRFKPGGPFVKVYCLGSQICFATSEDLIHWKRLGPERYFTKDERWYTGRWDSLFILPRAQGGWMSVFNTVPKEFRGLGFATSEDGIEWTAQAPVRVQIPWFEDRGYAGEISGFAKLGDKYFITCDAWTGLPYGKTSGAGLQRVFVSGRPEGPYRPMKRNHIIGADPSVYDKLHRSADGELITQAIVWTFPENKSRRYHVPPFKLVESDGENLWYRWWKQNENLKVHAIDLEAAKPAPGSGGTLALIDKPFDLDKGLVVEGTVDFTGVASPEPEADWASDAKLTSSCGRNQPKGSPVDGFPEAIADGNIETSWRHMGESQDEEGWLELDFGQVRPVGRIRILWWQRDEASYTIELSKDRETWQTVAENKAEKTQILYGGQEHGFSPMTFVNGLNTGARYLRIKASGPETVKRIHPQGVPRIGWLCGNKWGVVEINVHEAPDATVGKQPGSLPGIYFECEDGGGETVLFTPEGQAHFGRVNADGTGFQPYLTREIGRKPGARATFRIVQRDDLAEIYLDDYQLYIMHLRKPPTGRIGFIASGGQNVIGDVRAWYADPNATK